MTVRLSPRGNCPPAGTGRSAEGKERWAAEPAVAERAEPGPAVAEREGLEREGLAPDQEREEAGQVAPGPAMDQRKA
jgi:hypothetical protein